MPLSEGCCAIPVLNVTVLFLMLGLSVEHLRILPFYFSTTLIFFLCVFIFLVALAMLLTATKQTKTGQALCHVDSFNVDFLLFTYQCAVDGYQAIPF